MFSCTHCKYITNHQAHVVTFGLSVWQPFEAHLCPLKRAVLDSGTKAALIESCCSVVFHVIVLYGYSQPCSHHTLKVSRVENYVVEKRSVWYGKLCTETAKLWSLLLTSACRGTSENSSRINQILLTHILMQDGVASTEHTRGMWEAGVRWKYPLLRQIHHWYMKMKLNYTRDYIVPIWVFMPGKFSVSMGIKFAPAVLGCTAECFCPSAKGLNRQLRFLRKDVENVNQKECPWNWLQCWQPLQCVLPPTARSDRLQQHPRWCRAASGPYSGWMEHGTESPQVPSSLLQGVPSASWKGESHLPVWPGELECSWCGELPGDILALEMGLCSAGLCPSDQWLLCLPCQTPVWGSVCLCIAFR